MELELKMDDLRHNLLSKIHRNRILSEKTINKPTKKRSKHIEDFKDEALQQLYRLRPDLNDQSVWFFPTLKKSAKGRILYEKSEKCVYVYDMITQKRYATFCAWIKALSNKRFFKGKKSALSTIFLNPSCNGISVGQIIKGENYASYFKNSEIITLIFIKNTLTKIMCNNPEFANITLVESEEFLRLIISDEKNMQKELHIKQAPHGCREPIGCSIFVNGFEVKDYILKNNSISTKISKMDDVVSIMRFCKKSSICVGQYTKGFEQATYLREDHIYSNSLGPKSDHGIIANLENKGADNEAYHRTIKSQEELVRELRDRLELKFEAEEENTSEPLASVIHNVVEEVKNKEHENISNIILRELIRVQSEKPKGLLDGQYQFIAESYINETNQHTGWQDKAVERMIANMEANNMWGYARLGFFSHDSFKILKGLLWSQRDNKYVGYIDFDDEIEAFGKKCLYEIQNHFYDQNKDEDEKNRERTLATQVHQIVWHSITHPFNFPIAYFAIETMDIHTLNTILFSLAAKLECIAIHTCGSVCDGAAENRKHIKSFDWFAATWKIGNKIEVQLSNKSGKKSYKPSTIIFFNPERTEFLVELFDIKSSCHNITRSALCPPMPAKTIWHINDPCEVRNMIDNEWFLATEQIIWKSLLSDICPAYDENKNWMWHLIVNPVTNKKWFFLNDPIHVFKKLRNNVSKSHSGNNEGKNVREIMFDNWEISWRYFRGVYDYTIKHVTARATKLTKRHIWLTPWSKMRIDLAEYTLSLEVKKAMAEILELKNISYGTQNVSGYHT
ncbi:hypothetical protein C2G38_2042939 [Gigaspora rosea]|uniref:Transposable element P transposase-like RNase H domain-containing protein n=1 Tax=Gigaspora rosea TaxID=44941 RepID=A0A397ULT1_9GLOM|nr:hypothetical protein C2G38_2042939 [Gigaspora rosea]